MSRDVLALRPCLAPGILVVAVLAAEPAAAHGFGQRFDLPLPLWFWVTGAGASIVLSFVVMALFVHERATRFVVPQYDLLRVPPIRALTRPAVVETVRAVAVFVFLLTIAAGLFGAQSAYSNLIVTMVWVIWWVGIAFASALIGDVWALLSPIRTLFDWTSRALGAPSDGRGLSLRRPYPRWLGVWPAILLFGGFAWAELIWDNRTVPRRLALAVLGYSLVTWIGMGLYGRKAWLRNGEAFSVAFGVLARFAPLYARMRPPALFVRPPGSGLTSVEPVSGSFLVFILLMLSTATIDGFLETPLFQDIGNAIYASPTLARLLFEVSELGISEQQVIMTGALIAFPLGFLLAFWLASWAMVGAVRYAAPKGAGAVTAGVAARAFVLTLVPIAVAYHLSHYFSYLLTTGQFIIPLASDPFGYGWDLFGTKGYRVDLGLLSPYVFWYSAVGIIVFGHVVAVFLSHVAALRLFGTRSGALISQIPMVALMVAYTTLSLWILAQPIMG